MYQVQYRLPGGAWQTPLPPSSLQVAAGTANAVKELQKLPEVRIETGERKPDHLVDLLV